MTRKIADRNQGRGGAARSVVILVLVAALGIFLGGALLSPGSAWATPPANGTIDATHGDCGACHGYTTGFSDGARSAATGLFPGSHNKHAQTYGFPCGNCHQLVSAGSYSHRNGYINMVPLASTVTTSTGAYSKGTTSFPQVSNPTLGTCSTVYCHSTVQGTNGTGAPSSYSTPTWGNNGSMTCGSCHADMSAASSPTNTVTGSHATHAGTVNYAMTCGNCHSGYTPSSVNYLTHAKKTIDVNISATYGGTFNGSSTPGSGYASCSTTYCHSDGLVTYKTPTWGSATTGACGTCHGVDAYSAPTSTPHAKHVGQAAGYQFACVKCHSVTASLTSDSTVTPTIISKVNHVNKSIDLAFDSYNPAGVPSGVSGSQQCSNIYCHGNGTTTSPTVGPLSWTGNTTCSSCHGNTTALLTSGSHSWHIQYTTGATPITCNNCHNATAASSTALSSSTGTAHHVNQKVDINFNSVSSGSTATYDGQIAGGATVYQKTVGAGTTAASTCYTTYCHGGKSPVWGTNTTNSTCVKCHGAPGASTTSYTANNNLAAPGYISAGTNTGVNTSGIYGALTGTGNVSNDSKVGAHDSHLSARYNYSAVVQCNDCHPSRTSPTDSSHMIGTTQFLWSSLSNSNLGMSPTYTPATGQCSSVYCHGGGLGAGVTGSAPTPTWTNTTYLNGNRSHDCNQCHVSPPTSAAKYDHSAYSINTDCSQCHGHNGAGSTHINGTLDGRGACNACHWYDSTDVNAWAASGGTYTGTTSYGTYTVAAMVTQNTASYYLVNSVYSWGAHKKHINHLETVNSQVLSGPVDTFGGAPYNNVCGVCHTHLGANHQNTTREINFADGSMAYSFDGVSAPTYSSTTGVCSNVSCHFQASPAW